MKTLAAAEIRDLLAEYPDETAVVIGQDRKGRTVYWEIGRVMEANTGAVILMTGKPQSQWRKP